jgi:hypothetical protein
MTNEVDEVDDETVVESYETREAIAEVLQDALASLDSAATLVESLQDDELLKTLDSLREQVHNLI